MYNIKIIETDISSICNSDAEFKGCICFSKKGTQQKPILLESNIKSVKWYQFWRYKDKERRRVDLENKFNYYFGKPTEDK